MRRIIVSTYATLNGVIQDPQNWSFDYFDEEAGKFAVEQLFAADALLLGRETYQSFAEAWPSRSDEAGFADKINSMDKYVVSTTLTEPLEWGPATLIKENVVAEVTKLKQQPGQDILIYGTGRLAYTLLQHDLIDEHRLWIVPILWGTGRRIFEGVNTTKLELVDTKTLPSGTVILSHKLAQKK
jgi:dihydrofolate reductase